MHKSRLCYITIDVNDLDRGTEFWSKALNAQEEDIGESSKAIYRRLRLPDQHIRILLQKVPEKKQSKTRLHLDLETDNVEAEAERLKKLGAKKLRLEAERGFRFCVMCDPFDNEFCILQTEYPELLGEKGNFWE